MDCIVYGVTKNRTRLGDFHFQCKLDRRKHKVQILPKGIKGNRNNSKLPKMTLQLPKVVNSY